MTKQEYLKQIPELKQETINKLNSIILSLKDNSFQLPIKIQNSCLDKLLQAKELLNILRNSYHGNTNSLNLSNNPFSLIYDLSEIVYDLNKNTFKNIHQIISAKTNNLLIVFCVFSCN